MPLSIWYNEIDPQKAAWLRELIHQNVIAPGEVDERSIADVDAAELQSFTQCHFFAGIGVWSYALRLAGWPDARPVWTGSCPCPSFSAAGKGKGFADPRHLWPDWFRLIRESRPANLFGEQVNAAIGHGWLDLVQSDLEKADYAVGKAVLGARSVGAPHIRQRLYFCAHLQSIGWRMVNSENEWKANREGATSANDSKSSEREDAQCNGRRARSASESRQESRATLAHDRSESNVRDWRGPGWLDPHTARSIAEAGATRGFWADCDWWHARDGKYRPIEPGIFPLAHGVANRVLKLRGYGDAIVAETAKAFIEAAAEDLES